MKLVALFSGGKDSHLAMYKASHEHTISCALTMYSQNSYSYMFQTLGVKHTKLQLKCQNVPQLIQETQGEKEFELDDLKIGIKKAVAQYRVKGVVTGAVKSTYQAIRVQKICQELDLWCFNPLWDMDSRQMLYELKEAGFEVYILGIFAYPLTQEYVTKSLLHSTVMNQLLEYENKYSISAIGEGGEIETFVLNGPMYTSAHLQLDFLNSTIQEESQHCAYVSQISCKLIK